MMCVLKRIAVEFHNVPVHERDLMRISSLSGRDYTTFGGPTDDLILLSATKARGNSPADKVRGLVSYYSSQAGDCSRFRSERSLPNTAEKRRMPLNSRRVTGSQLRAIAEELGIADECDRGGSGPDG